MKKLFKFFCLLPTAIALCSCNNTGKVQTVTEIKPYLYEVETYTELDWDYADKFYASENDNWSGGGCSAITKKLDDGTRLIGRNMDLNISNNCAYIVRTDAGEYKTMGLQYTFRGVSPTYESVKQNGISEKWSKLLPFYCDDVMNDQGFHIEINMRHGEYYPNGGDMFAIESTNPDGERRVHMFELPRYLAENCATIAEAKELVSKLDIYSKNYYWNYCFIMADATGAASLLEFCNDDLLGTNGIYWFDETSEGIKVNGEDLDATYLDEAPYYGELNYHAIAQTNFFLNRYGFRRQDIKSGFGRLKALQDGIDGVKNIKNMYDLMNKVAYSNFYKLYDDCKTNNFDPRSEQVGEKSEIPLVSAVVMNDEYEPIIKELMDAYTEPIRNLTRQEKRDANEYWESTFTEVVDVTNQTIYVRVFEDESLKFKLTFEGTTQISAIE